MSLARAESARTSVVDEDPRRTGMERAVVTRRSTVPRTPGEWVLIATLLLGLALSAGVLLTSRSLTRADLMLGSSVFFVGLALLVLMEICRRSERNSR